MTALRREPAGPLRVHVLESAAEMAALGDAWETLQRDAAVASIFASFDWQSAWWRAYGANRALRLVVAYAGDAPVGILPLYVQKVNVMRWPVRILRFVGSGGDTAPDDLGPVLAAATRTRSRARSPTP